MATKYIAPGDTKYMSIFKITDSNYSHFYPLNKAGTTTAYRTTAPITCINCGSMGGNVVARVLNHLGTDNSTSPYWEFDNSIAQYSTMLVTSWQPNFSYPNGITNIIFENPLTQDIVRCNNIYNYTNNYTLLYNGCGLTNGNVLAIGFPELSTWAKVRIKFEHSPYTHAFVAFKEYQDTTVLFPWEIRPKLYKMNDLYYSISNTNYNTETKMYNSVNISDFDTKATFDDMLTEITIDGETFKPIDKFDNFSIVQKVLPRLSKLSGLKSQKELVVANDDIDLSVAQNIDSFKVTTLFKNNGVIKIALSIDKGSTWLTWDSLIQNFIPLPVTISKNKNYSAFTDLEKSNWNQAADTILNSGISVVDFNRINFKLLAKHTETFPETLRFAYAISRQSYSDTATTSKLEWQFDAVGHMELMSDNEKKVMVYGKSIKMESLINNPIIQVNILT